ncbi:MAG: EAL domain-containing protein [Gammaproteobacteria bacterium]|nr:EAL domain-containing protein [Gammaproteobacteria bacterium]
MKDNIRLLITFGFIVILALMFASTAISVSQLNYIKESMVTLVEVTGDKTAAANDLRDAIRLRMDSLKNMRLKEGRLDRDNEYQRFINHSGKYRRARESLVSLGVGQEETAIHEHLQQLIEDVQSISDEAATLLISNAPDEQVEPVLEKVGMLQKLLLERLNELIRLEQENTKKALASSRSHYSNTRNFLFLLTAVSLLFSALFMRTVIKRVSAKNQQLAYQGSHDTLTGLINRREFEQRVERTITHARAQSATHALLYLDLDQFKIVNDTCGHAAGDVLLQQLAQILLGSVRHRDTLSRLGGDEFGMLLENCPLDKAVVIANNLLSAIENYQFNWDESSYTLGISIGVVPINRSTTDIGSTMSAADSACYIAKESGRNRIQIAHLGDRRLQERHGEMQWVARLNRALEKNQFALYFQPILPCYNKSTQVRHLEILIRLIDDDGAVIVPANFFPAAEKYNLMTSIDRWVIERSLAWLAEHSHTHGSLVTIAISLSGQSISSPDMHKFVINKIGETGVSPEQLIFELTEAAAIKNITAATSFMLSLRGSGFRFALNNFGSGLSSFSYLKKLPVDFLKIDGMNIRDILSDPVDYAMVKSINELGQLLGKETIASNVETVELAEELRKLGVNYMQGHAYGRPQPLNNFIHFQGPRLVVVSS